MKKTDIKDIPQTLAHNGVPRRALIKVGDLKSNIETVNDAHLSVGKEFSPHAHNDSEEVYYFLEGTGQMTVNGNSFPIMAGTCVIVELGELHGIKNTGTTTLRFITIRSRI